jgi:hypothetical protein
MTECARCGGPLIESEYADYKGQECLDCGMFVVTGFVDEPTDDVLRQTYNRAVAATGAQYPEAYLLGLRALWVAGGVYQLEHNRPPVRILLDPDQGRDQERGRALAIVEQVYAEPWENHPENMRPEESVRIALSKVRDRIRFGYIEARFTPDTTNETETP